MTEMKKEDLRIYFDYNNDNEVYGQTGLGKQCR